VIALDGRPDGIGLDWKFFRLRSFVASRENFPMPISAYGNPRTVKFTGRIDF